MVVIALALTIGTLLGAVAGYFGGRVGEAIMRVTDIFLTIPDLILAMAFAAALGPGLFNVMIAVSLVWWPGYCRLTRANVIALRDSQFADAARSIGAGSRGSSSATSSRTPSRRSWSRPRWTSASRC